MFDLDHAIASATTAVREAIADAHSRLASLEVALDQGRTLNNLGALQASGSQLDAAVAALATLQGIQREQRFGHQDAADALNRAGGVPDQWIADELGMDRGESDPRTVAYRAALRAELYGRRGATVAHTVVTEHGTDDMRAVAASLRTDCA